MWLGIDIGTSSVKLSLLNDAGDEVATATSPLTVQTPHPYWSEQDPDSWWRATIAACNDLRQRCDLNRVLGVGLSGQMHGAVLLDEADQAIRPAILWNDGRCFAEAEALAAQSWIADLAGAPPLPSFTAPKLMWLKRHDPGPFDRIRHILLPKDYVGLKLHGRHVTDKSDAAGTLWLDQAAQAWSADLCDASGIDLNWLPTCVEGSEVVGQITADAAATLGLPKGVPVVAGGGDAAAGAISVGAIKDGDCFLSLGTSGQLFVATDAYRPNPAEVVHAYAHCVPDMWFQMAAMLNGAHPMDWFGGICGAPVGDLLAEAAAVNSKDAPIFLPFLTGERTPHGDPHIRGGFHGLADGMTRAHMMRAVVDGIAFSFADATDALTRAGAKFDRVPAIGGGARSDLLLQTIADVTGFTVTRGSGEATGAALGAALLAAPEDLREARRNTADGASQDFAPAPSEIQAQRLTTYRELTAQALTQSAIQRP
ncbi:MAG: xylulokinase [Paracoccaceae bacterium]|nr:xylulokinase [Paracoccaceae bacterium]